MALLSFIRLSGINLTWSNVLITCAVLFALDYTCYAVYQLCFHPLAKFPGPKIAALTNLWKARVIVSGYHHTLIDQVHKKYGQTVRIGPNEVSTTHPTAWKDIYGHHNTNQTFTKDARMYASPLGQRESIVTTIDISRHAASRRLLSHAFSDRALSEQEELIQKYATKLIDQLKGHADRGPVNILHWFNFFTFDVIGELSFGESFGCLDTGVMNDWIVVIFNRVKALAFAWSLRSIPLLASTYQYFLPASLRSKGAQHMGYAKEKVLQRLKLEADRKDFISCLAREDLLSSVSVDEMSAHSASIVLAGSDTTATTLSSICYYLGHNPHAYTKLTAEIRSAFKREEDITHLAAQKLQYLQAVMEESLRMYPPLPIGAPRRAPDGGAVVGDFIVPRDCYASVPSWTVCHSEDYFPDAWSFQPERWFDKSGRNHKEQSQPFSMGPRGCIGRNLAWVEMRIVLCKLFWNFDFEIVNKEMNWERDSQSFIAWQKPELIVQLTPII